MQAAVLAKHNGGWVCAADNGNIRVFDADAMAKLLKTGCVVNLTFEQFEAGTAEFPDGDGIAAPVILRGGDGVYKAAGKDSGGWYVRDINAGERRGTADDLREPHAVTASQTAPEVLYVPPVQTVFHYIAEACDGDKVMRYIGLEYTGAEEVIDKLLPSLEEKSVLFRDEYFKTFNRHSMELAVQKTDGKVFAVLSYDDAIRHLTQGTGRVNISRVFVSAAEFSGSRVLGEAYVLLSGAVGRGQRHGSGGEIAARCGRFADEIAGIFMAYKIRGAAQYSATQRSAAYNQNK